ncbi:oligosaccharide flippase family protein [bacterium]|nr:oligosaccharide flippase family protein [bacterium]
MALDVSEALPDLSQRVAKTTVVVLIGQILSLAANLGVTVLLARYLGERGFGLFSYGIVVVSFFAVIADFGMKPIVVREISRQPEKTGAILGNAILLKLVLCFIAIVLTLAAITTLGFSLELKITLVLLTGTFIISSKTAGLRLLLESTFHARLRMEIPIMFQTLDALVLIVLTALLIERKASLLMLVAAYVLSNVPGFFLSLAWLWKTVKPSFRVDKNLCRMLLQESLPLLFYTIIMTLYGQLDVILIEAMQGQEFVGLYAAAFRLVSPLLFIPTAVVTSLYPLMSQYGTKSQENLEKICVAGIKILAVIGLPLALGAMIKADQVFLFIYPRNFAPAIDAFKLLMWAQFFVFLNFFFESFNTSINKQKVNFRVALLMALMNLGLGLVLIPQWDIRGASAAKLITTIIGFGLLFFYSHRGALAVFGSVATKLLAVGALLFLWLVAVKSLHLALVAVSSGVVYLLLLVSFGVFDARERQWLIQSMRRIV